MSQPALPADQLRAIAERIVAEAAVVVRNSDSHHPIHTKSTPTDIVTSTDLEAEALIRRRIAEATPGSRVLGEEGGHTPAGDGPHGAIEWIVDPIDGTVNFTYRIPITAVSVAAAIDGRVVAGAVADAERGEVFSAHLGGGATVDRRPIVSGRVDTVGQALVATGFSYDPERRRRHGRTVANLLGEVRDVRAFGSAALELCWVAMGRVDVYLERDIKPWDYAAASLVATEAGAVVELPCVENDGLVLAANAALHPAVRALVT